MYQAPGLAHYGCMRRVAIALPLLLSLLAACGSGAGDSPHFASTNDMRLKVTDLVGSSCGEAAADATSGSAMTCEWDGKQVTLITYPSEKQAQSGAEYLTGMGSWTVHQEGDWVVAVTGDQPDLEQLVAKVKA